MENPFAETARESAPPSSEKPASTRRLRELAAQKESLTQADVRKEIEERMRDLMHPAYKIGEGQSGDVYCGRDEDGLSGFCIKHLARITPETALDNSLEREMELQEAAYRILEDARRNGLAVCRVPMPWAYIKTSEGEEIVSMDRVPGKTLRRLMLERAAHHMPDTCLLPGYQRNMLEHANDEDLEFMVIARFLNPLGNKSTAEIHRALVEKAGDPPFLTKEIALTVRNTINTLNKKGFYHRDIHAKNIMFREDLTEAYLIDFGRSSYKEHLSMEEATNVERVGEKVRYLRDEGILSTISSLIPKPTKTVKKT